MSQKSIDTVHGAIFAVSYGILCPATLFSYLFFLMYYRAFLPDAWSDLTPKAFVIPAFFLFCLGFYVFVHLWKVNYWRRHEKRLIHTEPTEVTLKDGRKHNGSLLYTIRPIAEAVEYGYEQQMMRLQAECRHQKVMQELQKCKGR